MAEVAVPPSLPAGDRSLEIACRDFVELVTEHLEGTLPEHVEQAIAAHLALCDPCVDYLDQIRRTSSLLRSAPPVTLSPAVRDELLAVYAQLHPDPSEGHGS